MTTLVRSLNHRPFAWLLGGQTLSRVGDYLYQVVLAWWVLQETGSAVAMSGVVIISIVPTLIFTLLGGVAGDRFPRVQVMLWADFFRGCLFAATAALAYSGSLQLWHVYAISLLFGVVEAFSQPAFTALVPELVPPADLPSANSLYSMSHQFGRIVGPALAGVVLALGGATLGFAVNALSFFLSAALLVPLLGVSAAPRRADPSATAGDERPPGILREAREGIGVVLANPVLWIAILVFGLANVSLFAPYGVSLPFLVEERAPGNVHLLGWLYALFAVGYVLGSVWLGRKAALHRRGWLIYGAMAAAALCILLMGLPLPLLVVGLAAVGNGVALEAVGLAWTNVLQEVVPGDKLGRVASIDFLGSNILFPVGIAAAGWLTDTFSAGLVFVLGGGLTVLLSLLALTHPAIRRLD